MSTDWPPDYERIYRERSERLAAMRAKPELLPQLKAFYAEHPDVFIDHHGMTFDPRQSASRQPVEVPFVLFERQRQMIAFILERMARGEPGLVEKSRDMGASWLLMALAATLCLFRRSTVVGIGSSKEDRVDKLGDPSSLLWKARFFLKNLPAEFRGSWDETRDSAHLRVRFPDSGSAIVGEAGDQIGRGGRSTVYFIDEAAFLERPQLAEMSLASDTNTRIDVSTPCGRANSFAVKRWSGKVPVFRMFWMEDPRKDARWYQRQVELLDPVTLAQEVDLSYDASIEGLLLPAAWVHASIGAAAKLGIEVTGARRAALDVADEGKDKCALAGRHGVLLELIKSWSGKGSDIYRTVARTFALCEARGYDVFDYDADGLGAGVRGDAVAINAKRREAGKHEIQAEPFRGSGAVFDGEGSLVEGRLNKDYFANLKAQTGWALRLRFQNTFRAVIEKLPYDADSIICIDPQLPELQQLVAELVQPTYSINTVGKIVIDKTPDGAMSPNLFDGVMMAFSPFRGGAFFASSPASDAAGASSVKVYPLPKLMDAAFAVVSFVEDSAAVVWAAANHSEGDGTRGPGFFILDWDLKRLDASAEQWLRGVTRRLEELYDHTVGLDLLQRRRLEVFVDSVEEGFAAWMKQRGFDPREIGEDVPPLAERFNAARPYVNVGLVRLAEPAHQRVIVYKGATRNFLRELLSAEEVLPSNPLATAFATAILLTYRGRAAVPPPTPIAPEDFTPHDFSGAPWRGFRLA
jgi:phage terminase large subunit